MGKLPIACPRITQIGTKEINLFLPYSKKISFGMPEIIYREESYAIIGICMKVHRILGHGFIEKVYKDALEVEFIKSGIPYQREHGFEIQYEGQVLNSKFYADFTVYNKIILEVKALDSLPPVLYARTINYLKCSDFLLGLLVNFGAPSFQSKRLILTEVDSE
jgi:GxxExxY protein